MGSFFFQNLAAEKTYNNLEITVEEALKHREGVSRFNSESMWNCSFWFLFQWFEGVLSCKETDSLGTVIETLVKHEV